MKKTLIFLLVVMAHVAFGQAPCDAKMYDTLGFESYEGVMPLKTFSFNISAEKKFSSINVICNKDTDYRVRVGNSAHSQAKVKVEVLQGKTIISEQIFELGELANIDFTALTTGMYQFQVTALEPKSACITLVLGYSKN